MRLPLVAAALIALAPAAQADEITIFAAASLKTALDEIAADWQGKNGDQVVISYAGSSQLAKQIQEGAPADLFISASTGWMDAVQKTGNSDPATRRDLLGNTLVLVGTGKPAKALETLEPVLGQIDKDSTFLTLAGQAYLQNGEASKAAEYFAKASKLDPENSNKRTSLAIAHMAQGNAEAGFQELQQISAEDKGIMADLALITAHLKNNQLDKALQAIDVLEKKQPDNPATHNLRARALLAKKDIAGARKSFDKALSINPTFFPAVASLAGLDLADKKPEEARKRFEAVISADPKNTQALLALAELTAASGGSVDEVSNLIGKAVTAAPTEVGPRLALIGHLLKSKDNKKAQTAANDAVAAMPDKPEILDALGRVQMITGDLNQASTTYGKMAGLQPASPLPLFRQAEVHFANKNQEDGAKSLKKALEIKPDMIEAQQILVQLALEKKNVAEALGIAKMVQKQRPKEAAGYQLEGAIHASNQSWPQAVDAFRSGMKAAPSNDLAVKLHSALLAAGNKAEAEKHANTWLKEHPKDPMFRVYLGGVEHRGQFHLVGHRASDGSLIYTNAEFKTSSMICPYANKNDIQEGE